RWSSSEGDGHDPAPKGRGKMSHSMEKVEQFCSEYTKDVRLCLSGIGASNFITIDQFSQGLLTRLTSTFLTATIRPTVPLRSMGQQLFSKNAGCFFLSTAVSITRQ